MLGVSRELQRLNEASTSEKQALADAVALLFGGRQSRSSRLVMFDEIGLLLFDGLTFPTTRHFGIPFFGNRQTNYLIVGRTGIRCCVPGGDSRLEKRRVVV